MAVGVSFAAFLAGNAGVELFEAMLLAIGIAIQNIPEGAIISMPLKMEGVSRAKAFLYGVLSGIVEPIGAISAGIVNNLVMVDLCYVEDSSAQVDSNIVLTSSGKIIEFQTTAEGAPFEKEQMDEIFSLAKSSIETIIEMY